jgi:hypothetical protein
MKCFKRYEFAGTVAATGYRYSNGHKIGYAFDLKFSEDQSYIHVVTKP